MGLKSGLMGKPSSQESKNVNNDMIKSAYGGSMGATGQATGLMSALLGGDSSGAENYANSGGMKFLMDNMAKGVTSTKAAQGLLNSGSYGTALQDRASGIASTYLDQYMNHVNQLGELGLGAGKIVSGAGETQKAKGQKQGLLQSFASGAGSALAAGG